MSSGLIKVELLSGPIELIKNEVKDKINLLGKNGGYFCSPDQGMSFPPENLQAYEDALVEYGGIMTVVTSEY